MIIAVALFNTIYTLVGHNRCNNAIYMIQLRLLRSSEQLHAGDAVIITLILFLFIYI